MDNASHVQIGIDGMIESIIKIIREPNTHKLIAIQEHEINNLENSTIRITFEIETKFKTEGLL